RRRTSIGPSPGTSRITRSRRLMFPLCQNRAPAAGKRVAAWETVLIHRAARGARFPVRLESWADFCGAYGRIDAKILAAGAAGVVALRRRGAARAGPTRDAVRTLARRTPTVGGAGAGGSAARLMVGGPAVGLDTGIVHPVPAPAPAARTR